MFTEGDQVQGVSFLFDYQRIIRAKTSIFSSPYGRFVSEFRFISGE